MFPFSLLHDLGCDRSILYQLHYLTKVFSLFANPHHLLKLGLPWLPKEELSWYPILWIGLTVAAVIDFIPSCDLTKGFSIFQSSDTNLKMMFTASDSCVVPSFPSCYLLLHFFPFSLYYINHAREIWAVWQLIALFFKNLSKLISLVDDNASFQGCEIYFKSMNTLAHNQGFNVLEAGFWLSYLKSKSARSCFL